jgi:peptidoglycan/LPS O-acetylase OafA/YrhL
MLEKTTQSTFILITLFVIIAIIPYTILSTRYPVTYDVIHDYARHSQFIFFVLAGIFSYKYKQVMLAIELNRVLLFQLAFASIITINIVRWNGLEPKYIWDNWLNHPISWLYLALLNINSWLWVLAILGYGKRYIKKGSKVLTYCNNAVYPFYILHQTVIVVIGYYVVQTRDDAAFKYAFLLIACFLISASIYHLYIRPFKIVRFTFGAK